MRQSGIIAAACDYALDHHVTRLAEDHANARRLAEGVAAIAGLAIDPATVETNLVYFDVTAPALDAADLCRRLAGHGVRMGEMGQRTVRAVTHLDVGFADIAAALDAAPGPGLRPRCGHLDIKRYLQVIPITKNLYTKLFHVPTVRALRKRADARPGRGGRPEGAAAQSPYREKSHVQPYPLCPRRPRSPRRQPGLASQAAARPPPACSSWSARVMPPRCASFPASSIPMVRIVRHRLYQVPVAQRRGRQPALQRGSQRRAGRERPASPPTSCAWRAASPRSPSWPGGTTLNVKCESPRPRERRARHGRAHAQRRGREGGEVARRQAVTDRCRGATRRLRQCFSAALYAHREVGQARVFAAPEQAAVRQPVREELGGVVAPEQLAVQRQVGAVDAGGEGLFGVGAQAGLHHPRRWRLTHRPDRGAAHAASASGVSPAAPSRHRCA